MLLTSLLLGLLIGLQRGWSARAEQEGTRVAGFRTFGLLGLLGGVVGILHDRFGAVPAALLIGGAVGALMIGYARAFQAKGRVSATTAIAALLTLCLGMMVANGLALIATALAAVITLLLASKQRMHRWVAQLGEADVRATARFVIIAAVILPLLPNEALGPFDAWNPHSLWLVVVLVTGFSFAGYAANKLFGSRLGTLATAAIGGLYSSTAVTVALSGRLRAETGEPNLLAAGINLAASLMFARVLILTAILAGSALPALAVSIAPAAALSVLATIWLLARASGKNASNEPVTGSRNPFELLPALGFAALVAVMAVGARWAESRFGDAGLATLIAISGSFDVDAAIVTLGALPADTLDPGASALVLAIPVAINTLFKAGVVIVTAGWSRGKTAALPLLATFVAMMVIILAQFA